MASIRGIRPVVLLVVALLAGTLSAGGGSGTTKKVLVAGVPWESSLEGAQARAHSEGKPILLLQMFGRLDDAYC